MKILAGWEVGSGRKVEIPAAGHLAWFGQTQLSGKTTALEGFVFRGGFKAIAFITKRGESSFVTAQPIQPYFSEPTNDPEQPLWKWVQSILEASQKRTLRFEESWIIRACEDPRQANTLAEVSQNILDLLKGEREEVWKGRGKRKRKEWKTIRKPVSGMNAGIYTSLAAYFAILMPQLSRLPYSTKLKLHAGLNVMDLRSYSIELQSLVIRSVLEYVYQHERNTRVIVPEAQDFVPEGRNSPVKMSCETMVRKGAADGNFMWLDSQDMAAVDKRMLRACSIIGCGVQGEINEINRTIGTLFGTGLKPEDIGRLKIGQFFIRMPGGEVIKTYVQPAWMDSEIHAQAIARGEVDVADARAMQTAFAQEWRESHEAATSYHQQESEETEDRRQQAAEHPTPDLNNSDLHTANRKTKAAHRDDHRSGDVSGGENPCYGSDPVAFDTKGGEILTDYKILYESLKSDYDELRTAHDAVALRLDKILADLAVRGISTAETPGNAREAGRIHPVKAAAVDDPLIGGVLPNMEYIYKEIKKLAQNDQQMLAVLARRPELQVNVKREVIEMGGDSLTGKVALLISQKFFDTPRSSKDMRDEFLRRGFIDKKASNVHLAAAINKLVSLGFLTAEPKGYQAVPSMKVNVREAHA